MEPFSHWMIMTVWKNEKFKKNVSRDGMDVSANRCKVILVEFMNDNDNDNKWPSPKSC